METKLNTYQKKWKSLDDFYSNGFSLNACTGMIPKKPIHAISEKELSKKIVSDSFILKSSAFSTDFTLRKWKKSLSISSPNLYFLPDFSHANFSIVSESSVFENNVNHEDVLERGNFENNLSILRRFQYTKNHSHKNRTSSPEFADNYVNMMKSTKSLDNLLCGKHTRSVNFDKLNPEITGPLVRKIRTINLHLLMREISEKMGQASDKEINLMKNRLFEGCSPKKVVDDWLKKVEAFVKTYGARVETLNRSLLKIMVDSLVQSPDDFELASKLFAENWTNRLETLKSECHISGLSDNDYNRTLSACFGNIYEAKITLIKEEIYHSLWPKSSRSSWKHIVKVLKNKGNNLSQAESYKRRVRMILAEKKIFEVNDEETAKKTVKTLDQLMDHMSKQEFSQETIEFDIETLVEKAKRCSDYKELIFNCICCLDDYPINQAVRFENKCDCLYCKTCGGKYFENKIDESTAVNIDKLPCLGCSKILYDPSPYFFAMIKKLVGEKHYDRLCGWFKLSSSENLIPCLCCGVSFLVPSDTKFEVNCPYCDGKFCLTCNWRGRTKHICNMKEKEDIRTNHNLIKCPECNAPVEVVRGGCLHLICVCKHEFCSGCCNAFERSDSHGLFCVHERNCLGSLRDYNVEKLEFLIKKSKIKLKNSSVISFSFVRLRSDEVSCARRYCNVLEKKEDNSPEESCSQPCYPSSNDFCEKHYKEHLVKIIKAEKIDPISIMDVIAIRSYLTNRHKLSLLDCDEEIMRENIAKHFPLA